MRIEDLDFSKLRAFQLVASHGTLAAAATQLGGDHQFALVFGFHRQQAIAVDVDVEVMVVGAPGLHGFQHSFALSRVVDHVHVRAGQEIGASASRVHVNHDVGHRKQHASEVVRQLFMRWAVGAAWEGAVEVGARGPIAGVALGSTRRQHRDDDYPARDLVRLQLLQQAHGGDLSFVLVAMVARQHQHGGPVALRNAADVDEGTGPTGGVGDLVDAQMTDLLARGLQVNAAGNGGGTHRIDSIGYAGHR